jgi:hypothetical protein
MPADDIGLVGIRVAMQRDRHQKRCGKFFDSRGIFRIVRADSRARSRNAEK